MVIYNFKVNGNRIFKIILIVVVALAIVLLGMAIFKLYMSSKFVVDDSIPTSNVATIDADQYTNILEEVRMVLSKMKTE